MKKTVCIVLCACFAFFVLVVPCFAVETTSGSVDWFGSQGVVGYSINYSGNVSYNSTSFKNWLVALNATHPSRAVGMTSGLSTNGPLWWSSDNNRVMVKETSTVSSNYSTGTPFTFSSPSSLTGYTEAETAFSAYVTDVMGGVDGFVDSGFSTALEICGDVVHYILNNTYILVAIGLAVALPLVAWGIGKVKTLIVGY